MILINQIKLNVAKKFFVLIFENGQEKPGFSPCCLSDFNFYLPPTQMNVTPDPNDPDGIYFINFNQDYTY